MKSIRVEQPKGPFKFVDEKIVEAFARPSPDSSSGVRHMP